MRRKTPLWRDASDAAPKPTEPQEPTFTDRLSAIQVDFETMKRSGGQPADKAWFDGLWA